MTTTPYSRTSASTETVAESQIWAGPGGLPSLHIVHAAVHVATVLDRPGSVVADARESYWHRATGGAFAPPDLQRGERLLVDCGLVEERDGTLYPLVELSMLLDGGVNDIVAAISLRAVEALDPTAETAARHADALAALVPDAGRREELLAALGRRFDDTHRRLIGAIGEEIVVAAARAELTALGYPELARAVRHVSLETDQAGYDVSAPRIGGSARLIEVKAVGAPGETVTVHVSRNEAETGARYEEWALVVCAVGDVSARAGEVVGWCPARALAGSLPADATTGRWESAAIELQIAALVPGLPGPVA